MIKILEEGKTTSFTTVCDTCGCKFQYDLEDISFKQVQCPQCNNFVTHKLEETDRIKKELCKYGNCERVPLPLMQKIVSKFYVGGDNELKMKLINGKTITRSVI